MTSYNQYVVEIKEEARIAFVSGKGIQSNPYGKTYWSTNNVCIGDIWYGEFIRLQEQVYRRLTRSKV